MSARLGDGGWRGWLVLLGAAGLLFPVQARLEASKPPPLDPIAVLPPARVLPILSAGYGEAAADLLEVRATSYLMRSMMAPPSPEQDQAPAAARPTNAQLAAHLRRLFEAIQVLDPNDPHATWRGAVYLASVASRPEEAIELLQSGAERIHPQHPERWLLYHEQAATRLLMLAGRADDPAEREAQVREAGRLWIQAAAAGGNPAWDEIGRRLATRGLPQEDALAFEVEEWAKRAERGDEVMRRHARVRLREAQTAARRQRIDDAVQNLARAGRAPSDLRELGPMPPELQDPLGVGYVLEDGGVRAPGLEAARIERRLSDRLERWRAARERGAPEAPPTAPTPDQLGIDVPPGIEVELDPERVRVVVAPDLRARAWGAAPTAPAEE